MKISKIIATLVGCVIAPVVSVFLSYSLDVMLTTQKLKLFDFNTCLEGLKVNQKQQQLFMIFTALLIGLIIFVVFVAMSNKYKADTITVTPKIKIPVPAGEGQNGSARFMNDSEKHSVFATYKLKQSSDLCRVLNSNGEDYYNAVSKKGKYLPFIPIPLDKINKNEFPAKGGLVVGMKKHGTYEEISYIAKDYHSLIFGATGSGKTRTLVLQSINFTAMAGEGIVVNDPKGEIYYYTHRVLESLGYEVIVMDLQNPEKSCGKNLLQPIIDAVNEKKTDKAQRATWDLIEMLVPKSDKGEPIWTNGEKAIIGACVLAVVCDNTDKPQYQNLTNVYYFLANMVKPGADNKTPLEGYIAKLDDTHPAKSLLGITDVAPSRTRSSFYTSALTTLRLFATNDIASVTGTSDFDFTTIAQKKQAIFYILPDQKTSYYPIVTLLVNQQYELLVDYAKEHGNRLPIRVNFFLDEFGNFTPISDIQAKLTVARGYGIRFNLFIQDMAQLEDKYDKNVANIIMGNCTVWVYLAAAGKETNELISSKLGKYTTLKYSSSGNKARYSNPSSGFSSQLEGRELLTADELARFARPYQLVMVLGEYPAVMVSYDLHKWQFNRFMGLGNESHNKQYIQIVTDSRQDKRNTNAKIPLWEVWKEQTPQAPQETEYNYLLRRKEAKENNEKSETYDITKNAFYIAEDEVIDKGEDLFRRKEQ